MNPPGVIVDFPVIGRLWTAEMVAAAINSEMENADLGSAFVENGHVVVSTRETGPDSSLRALHTVWFGPPNAVEELGFPRYAVLGSGENINSDPEFKDILTRNLHLKNSSPCIDAGNPASIVNDINGTRNDMGLWGGPEQKFEMLVRPWSPILYHELHQNFRDRPNSLFFSLECYIISEKAI